MQVADHVQKKLREVCLAYGAALMYVSSTTNNNDTLHRYLLHRLYPTHFQFDDAAEAVDGRRIFIPSGWDSAALIQDMDINEDLNLLHFGRPPLKTHDDQEKEEQKGATVLVAAAEATASDSSNSSASLKVTAYTEQLFLQRLLKKQEAGSNLRVSDTKLRDAVSNIGSSGDSVGGKKTSTESSSGTSGSGSGSSSGGSNGSSSGKGSSSNSELKTDAASKRNSSTSRIGKSSNSESGGSGSGGSGTSGSSGASTANAKDNPKLIKNFFQSLLNPKDKKAAGSKRRSTRSTRSSKPKE